MSKKNVSYYINKGASHFNAEKIGFAIKCFLKATDLDPQSVEAHFNLGLCYQKRKQDDKAIESFKKTILIDPYDHEALNNLGSLYSSKGKTSTAISYYKKAIEANPEFGSGYFNLGVRHQELGKHKKAISYYKKSLEFDPNNERAYNNLAVAYKSIGNLQKAISCFNKSLEIDPHQQLSLTNLGALTIFSDPAKSLHFLIKAANDKTANANVYYNLGVAYQTAGQIEEALMAFKTVIKMEPSFEQAYGQLFQKYRALVLWKKADSILDKMNKLTAKALREKRLPPETPFISVSTFQDPKRNLKVAKAWSDFDKKVVSSFNFNPKFTKRKNKKRLNIGYLSADYHDHATMHLIAGLLREHDKKRFGIFTYSYGPESKDKYRKLAQKLTNFRNVRLNSDLEVAQLVQKDKIDILVDLKGHTSGCRLGIMALKAAPIQATWLGFPGTTGADYIDYIIADKVVIPTEHKKYYTEKVIYLPDTYQPTDSKQEIAERRFQRHEFGLPPKNFEGEGIVFSCFNQPYKVSSQSFDVWMRILKKVEGSVLWLWEGNASAIRNYKKEAEKRGVTASRIVFAGVLSKDEHLVRIALADIALDTFTYNGHTTTSDCLWAGVPVVTLIGKHFASRVSASLLKAFNLPELITRSEREYEDLAVGLAESPKDLIKLKAKLRKNRLTEPLFDTERFTGNLERAYEKIWKKHT